MPTSGIGAALSQLEAAYAEAARCWQSEKGTVRALLEASCHDGTLARAGNKLPRIGEAFREYERLFAAGDCLFMLGHDDSTTLMTATLLQNQTKKNRQTPQHPFFGSGRYAECVLQ